MGERPAAYPAMVKCPAARSAMGERAAVYPATAARPEHLRKIPARPGKLPDYAKMRPVATVHQRAEHLPATVPGATAVHPAATVPAMVHLPATVRAAVHPTVPATVLQGAIRPATVQEVPHAAAEIHRPKAVNLPVMVQAVQRPLWEAPYG